MKFQLAINMERLAPDLDMADVERHTLEMVQMADEGGFAIAWAAEHHALEMTIAPNPFQILTWWAAHTSRIRLGSAVVVAAYWHPIKAAGRPRCWTSTAADGSSSASAPGAYQREFDRMHPGLQRKRRVPPHVRDAAGGEGALAGRLRARGRVLVLPGSDLGAEAAAEAPSAHLDRRALAGHLRLRRKARLQHPLLAAHPADVRGRGLQGAGWRAPWPTIPARGGPSSPPCATRWSTTGRKTGRCR